MKKDNGPKLFSPSKIKIACENAQSKKLPKTHLKEKLQEVMEKKSR